MGTTPPSPGEPFKPGKASEDNSTESKILAAAYTCFERYGVVKTTIEDIAKAAGVSRPTIYKFFAGKTGIIDRVSMNESLKVSAEVRRGAQRHENFADALTAALLTTVRVASENIYIRRIMEGVRYDAEGSPGERAHHDLYRDLWGGFIARRGIESGETASDLTLDQIVDWLTSAEGMLLIKVDSVPLTDQELSAFIRRFVVQPLLSPKGGSSLGPANP